MKRVECPHCGTDAVKDVEITKDIGGNSFIYPKVTCENDHEFGLELEVATILS